jgi:hypothetical protein
MLNRLSLPSPDSAKPPHIGTPGEQCLNILDDVVGDALRSSWIVLLDIGTERGEILDRLK